MARKWIQSATTRKKKGALHRQLGIPKDETIPISLLEEISESEPGEKIYIRGRYVTVTRLMKRRARFALNVRK